jgi:hypothetical protein
MAARLGLAADPTTLDFPSVEDGARTLKLIEAATASNERNGAWMDAALDLMDGL